MSTVAPTFTPNAVSVSSAPKSYTATRSGFLGTGNSPRAVCTLTTSPWMSVCGFSGVWSACGFSADAAEALAGCFACSPFGLQAVSAARINRVESLVFIVMLLFL